MALTTSTHIVDQLETPVVAVNSARRILVSCMIGNALEWYDFVIYGYFVVIFGALFFPSANPLTQILASWGIFWTGFLARPLGSIIFGHIGDKFSRKSALTLSIFAMAIPTALMGCLPTYAQVGIFAPILLVLLRTCQGFAIGGEFTGSMVFLVEHAPSKKRGFWGSWASFSAVIGVIVGSLIAVGLNASLSNEAMHAWGWRVPFLLSILGSVVGIYIRTYLNDPKVYVEAKAKRKQSALPFKDLFSQHKGKIGVIFLLDFLTAVGFFIVAIFLATYFRAYLHFPAHIALSVHTFSMCVFALAILLGGLLSDKVGRKLTLALPCLGFIFFSYPLFQLMQGGEYFTLLCAEATLALFMGLFFGTIPTTLVEMMPTQVRFSGLSIGHNICMAVIGGGTPFLATHLIQNSQNLASPAYLLMGAAFLSLCSLWLFHDRYQAPLDY